MNSHVFDRPAWARMTMFEQMGNIGSEVGRALSAKRRGKDKWMQGAFYRGLDLFDETAKLWAKSDPARLKELLYAREQFAKSITTDDVDATLEQYFMQFALAARSNR
jgi:hypothetical protein